MTICPVKQLCLKCKNVCCDCVYPCVVMDKLKSSATTQNTILRFEIEASRMDSCPHH